ncbi:hypothetical protein INT45_005135 [Circinella minor]|uniref:Uncharacterized protein n=1 Tax=Circinella minor TaxID=1195481 RepID=A0A8H7R5G0_9FUNG|nr:hypothetical protein INT45_005135 [Circinella minor]
MTSFYGLTSPPGNGYPISRVSQGDSRIPREKEKAETFRPLNNITHLRAKNIALESPMTSFYGLTSPPGNGYPISRTSPEEIDNWFVRC